MSTRVSIHTVFDQANFDAVLEQRVFSDHNEGQAWGEQQVAAYREARAAGGETDEVFLAAIQHKWHHLWLDDATVSTPRSTFK